MGVGSKHQQVLMMEAAQVLMELAHVAKPTPSLDEMDEKPLDLSSSSMDASEPSTTTA